MKYLKSFEREIVNSKQLESLSYFFLQFDLFKSRYSQSYQDRAKMYNIPEFLYDEFTILFFLYVYKGWWDNNYDTSIIKFIKKTIKKQSVESIIYKFEKDPEYYIILKTFLDRRPKFNNTTSLDYISDSTIKYIYFLLHTAIRKSPEWLKDTNKFNL